MAQNVPQLFSYNDTPVRTIQDGDDVWFVAKDVCEALGIKWQGAGKTLDPISDDWKGVGSFPTPGGKQELTIISEPAVYKQ